MRIAENFTKIPNRIIFDTNLTNPEVRIFSAILSYKYGDNKIFPSQGNIAKRLNISRRMVNKHIQNLAKKGYLSIKKRGYSMSNEYLIREEKFSDDKKLSEDSDLSNEKNVSHQLRTKILTKNTEVNNKSNKMIIDKDYKKERIIFKKIREKHLFLNR